MKKKAFAVAALAAACVTSMAFATPQTQFQKGQFQLDLGAWNVKSSVDMSNFDATTMPAAGAGTAYTGTKTSDSKWNFTGGLSYGLSDKWGLEYAYHDLNTKKEGIKGTDGDEHEVNLVYSLNKNFAVYGGWNRIKNSKDSFSRTNNIAQLGLIAKAPLAKNFDIYGKAAVGTKHTTIWEAGLGYTIGKDFDLTAGYRYVNTRLAEKGQTALGFTNTNLSGVTNPAVATSDANIAYKGPFVTLSYRFGGHKKAAPAPVVAEQPRRQVVQEQPGHVYNDYYLESVHFAFDVDTPIAYDQGKLDHFVAVAKEYPHDTFKLVGNTDARGTDAYNDDLSKRRVVNVARYAVDHGVNPEQLELSYEGKNDPVATNATDQGRADNRRVDIWHHR